ncbi:helix-turn-helix transcriptional regulator [Frankia sp. Cas4]|uniref:helix-turn-helix domain-containing protein n=1 Tax=Frankia sp. Cas4 TaxID=3073927 RepID=UPI002AD2420F|nr:helix-turn-helix transcriptional regulator [Frankia sp. Cas4]
MDDEQALAHLAGRIRQLREAAGIVNRTELARRARFDRSAVSKAESGKHLPALGGHRTGPVDRRRG